MKKYKKLAIIAGISLTSFLGAARVFSHHSFATQFDADQPIKMVGQITSVEWRNPHAWFYIDVKDEAGNVTNWGWELASPNMLMRNGLKRSSLGIGNSVTVEGFRSRDGSDTGNAQVIINNETGMNLFTGSNAPEISL